MIKAAINGLRTGSYHPLLPLNAETAASESQRSVEAGAEAIHVHVWNGNVESLHPDHVADFLNAIRTSCPGIPVGISTGEWIVPNLLERLNLLDAWDVVPDFVSLNTHEEGFEAVAALLWRKGVDIEAGLFDAAAAEKFSQWSERLHCYRVLLEPSETAVEEATATVEAIEALLDRTAPSLPRLLHGLDMTTWPMVWLAAERGYHTRIGFEDTVALPDGRVAQSNAELVRAAVEEVNNRAQTTEETAP